MKEKECRGIRKMSKYLSENYSSGSILERANYKKNKIRPHKVYGSMIERKICKKDKGSLWQRIKRIGQK